MSHKRPRTKAAKKRRVKMKEERRNKAKNIRGLGCPTAR